MKVGVNQFAQYPMILSRELTSLTSEQKKVQLFGISERFDWKESVKMILYR